MYRRALACYHQNKKQSAFEDLQRHEELDPTGNANVNNFHQRLKEELQIEDETGVSESEEESDGPNAMDPDPYPEMKMAGTLAGLDRLLSFAYMHPIKCVR
eukprot:NODE_5028_length_618_cov_251.804618.p2 GENE.NODE_5028_length_618_cov_251.804618~~NODE_5028_length_618_cov_251.804618.p2  ORF type:complete len:101 (-),score=10.03 NODE_5028_length_618_cov_251.804618:80-382(-)